MAKDKAKTTKASTPKKPVTPSAPTTTASADIDESEIGEDALDSGVGGAALLEICASGKHFPKVSL